MNDGLHPRLEVETDHDVTTKVIRVEDQISLGNSTKSMYVPALHTPKGAREIALEMLRLADEIDGAHADRPLSGDTERA